MCEKIHAQLRRECGKMSHMDQIALGARIKLLREQGGISQGALGGTIGLDRFAIGDIERGRRKVGVVEMLGIAEKLGKPLSYFLASEVPAVVSRRTDSAHAHESTAQLDEELRWFSSDVATLLERSVLTGYPRSSTAWLRVPTSHEDAERKAQQIRERAGLSLVDPVENVGSLAEHFGMIAFAADLGENGPDGAVVEVGEDGNQLGVAVINGRAPSGRLRMTMTHELGHWLTGDAYDKEALRNSERMLGSLSIHLLVPRGGVAKLWREKQALSTRDRAISIAAVFKVSWSAAVSQLRNLDLINSYTHRELSAHTPVRGEFARLGYTVVQELACPWVSSGFRAQVLKSYTRGELTAERTLEVLRGTLEKYDLPPQEDTTMADLQAMLAGDRG